MAPPPPVINEDASHKHRVVTVLVTGFGPFQSQYPVNPSWEIASSLPELLSGIPGDKHSIRIINCGSPIRVAYQGAKTIIPKLLDEYSDKVDLVLHMGMAAGRHYYTAEQYGHREGYHQHKDLDGHTPPSDEAEKEFPDCPPLMTTSLDFEVLVKEWQTLIAGAPPTSPACDADCRPSDNAGYYICDYTYFNSLVWHGRKSKSMDGGDSHDRPVMFLHVPAESDTATLERGQAVAIALIRVMVDLWLKDSVKAKMSVDTILNDQDEASAV